MDPRLVDYCRENLERFSPQQIRESLLGEGIDAGEVEAALRRASAPPPAVPPAPLLPSLSWLSLFLVLLGGFVLFIWATSRREHEEQRRREELAAQEEEKPEKAAGPASSPLPGDSAVMGYFGYALRAPAGYATTEGLCDPRRQEETLLIHPADMPPQQVLDREALLGGGGVLLTVRPRRDESGAVLDLAALRARLAPRERGARRGPSVQDAPGLPLSAFRVARPSGEVDTFLQGAQAFYQFTARSPGKPYEQLMRSLTEPEPRDRMRGFMLVADDPRTGRSYWHDATGTVITIPPGYYRVPVYTGRGVRYDFAYRHERDPFEARLRFDSTAAQTLQYRQTRAKPCFREGRCPAVDPDEPSDLWSASLAASLTAQVLAFDEIPQRLAEEEFNADWGMLSPGFELARSRPFNRPFGAGVLLQVHKNATGNYFVFFMASDFGVLNRHTNEPRVGLGIRFPGQGSR